MTTVDPTTVELDWNGAKSAAGYRLWVSNVKDGGTTPPEADENIIEDTHYGVGFLFPGMWNFVFCVMAVNGSFESDKSNCVIPSHPDGGAPTHPGDSALNLHRALATLRRTRWTSVRSPPRGTRTAREVPSRLMRSTLPLV